MKQVLQSLSDGKIELADVPAPAVEAGHVLIETMASLVSAGTERMLMEFGQANLLQKAMQQPHRVKEVLDKARTEGVLDTVSAIRSKLDQPIPLGYCNSGRVVAVGAGVTGVDVGDIVASNGPHSEIVLVSKHLCAKVPDNVTPEEAAFAVIGSIGLQGVRLVNPTLGEKIVVMGLGLIGLLVVQILRANGCNVLGLDFDQEKLELAAKFGAETVNLSETPNPVAAAMQFSSGSGVDAVLITASTKSSDPVSHAAQMSRKRGRIVLVGVTGLELNRAEFYEKELSFQVSCSYGPGRYDPDYEEKGRDYPIAFVRWTEQRNIATILELIGDGRIDVSPLISSRVEIGEAKKIYAELSRSKEIGTIFTYPDSEAQGKQRRYTSLYTATDVAPLKQTDRFAVIGAGNYASRVLVPGLKAAGAKLDAIVSRNGMSAYVHGSKNGFSEASTDVEHVLNSDQNGAVVIATRHNTHADFVVRAVEAGKHVFVEKPLALSLPELDAIRQSVSASTSHPIVMVGFNRRFSPLAIQARDLANSVGEPKTMIITVNAGAIPAESWIQDMAVGGGRIIGEGCHFIDLLRYFAGTPITDIKATRMGGTGKLRDDKATITVSFADGSHGTVHYFANGSKAFPKERIEIFCGESILQIDNWRLLKAWGVKGFSKKKLSSINKGQTACIGAFVEAVQQGLPSPIPFAELLEVSEWTIRAAHFDNLPESSVADQV